MRIHIIGNSCTGKSTFAAKLSKELGIAHHNLDDIYWKRKFDIPREKKERIDLLEKLTRQKEWITESAGTSWTQHAITRADIVVELRNARVRLVWRAFLRFLRRKKSGPKETLQNLRELITYIWRYHNPKYKHMQDYLKLDFKNKVVLRNQKQRENFIRMIAKR